MFAIICRRRLRFPSDNRILVGPDSVVPQSAVFSTQKSSPEQSFAFSYLVRSCGLSSKDALSVSKKLCIKSSDNPDAVMELLRRYGFTNAQISKLVTRLPHLLLSCPRKTLLPKLEFLRSIGIPTAVLANNLSTYPRILHRSLDNFLIPLYNYLKNLVLTGEGIVRVFKRAPLLFDSSEKEISSKISLLRARGVRDASLVCLVTCHPFLLLYTKEKLAQYIDQASELGFDPSKHAFVHALVVLRSLSESTMRHKFDVYTSCGWTDSDITAAFLRFPICMALSEKKIMANMDFLVSKFGCTPADVARRPVLLGLSLSKRMKPRFLIAEILKAKGLLKKTTAVSTMLMMTEATFLNRYIIPNLKAIPQLSDIYSGKLSLPENEFQDLQT